MVKNRILAPRARLLNTLPGGSLAFRINLFPHIAVIGFFLIYLITLSPQIFWRDSAEFVATSYSLGVSHPPGSPTYNLLAKVATFLPLGSITFKVHLFSAICAVFTGFLLYKTIKLILENYFSDVACFLSHDLIAILSTSLFCFSFAFWRWSICAEVYSLQELFIILMIYLSLQYKFKEKKRDYRLVFLIAFLFSLSLGAHMTNALYLPAFSLLFIQTDKKILSLKRVSLLSFFALLGFSIYLYLPLRYYAGAPLRLGSPSNWSRFFSHITARRAIEGSGGVLEQHMSPSTITILPTQLWNYIENIEGELSFLGVLLGIVGLLVLTKMDRRLAGFTSLIFLGNIFFFRYWRASFGYIPSFLVCTIWIGIGTYGFFNFCFTYLNTRRRGWLRKEWIGGVIILALLGQAIINLSKSLQLNNLMGFYTLYDYTKKLSNGMERYSVLITQLSIPQFPLWYFQVVENRRPDIITIPMEEFPTDGMIDKLLVNEWDSYNFYLMGGSSEKMEFFYKRLVPRGLIFKFNAIKDSVPLEPETFTQHLDYRTSWERELRTDNYVNDYESYAEIYRINENLLWYYLLRNEFDLAHKEFSQLLKVNPNSIILNHFYGYILSEKKNYKKAAEYFDKSLRLAQNFSRNRLFDRERELVILGIGITLLNGRHYKEAIRAFNIYIDLNPLGFGGHYYLGLALAADSQLDKALQEFRTARTLKPADQEVKSYIKKIEEMLSLKGNSK